MDRRGAGSTVIQQTRVRHILVQPNEIRSEGESEALINDIRARLEAGASFEDLARDYSDDPGSALSGGDLGWTQAGQMVPAFEERMMITAVGETSDPFRSRFGFHILEVLERRDQDMSDEMRERQALRILRDRRFDEELQAWLREIRDEAFEMKLQHPPPGVPASVNRPAHAPGAMTARIAITPGEPAGIGPELAAVLAQRPRDVRLVAVCDPSLLEARAAALDLPLKLLPDDGDVTPDAPGTLRVCEIDLAAARAGRLDVRNVPYVLATLDAAIDGCVEGRYDAMVTRPYTRP